MSRRARRELKREPSLLQLHRFCNVECDHDLAEYQRVYGEATIPCGSTSVSVNTVVLARTSAVSSLRLLDGEIYTGPSTPILRHSQSIAVKWLDGEILPDEFRRYSDYMSSVVACRASGVEIPSPPELPHIQLLVSEPGTPTVPLADYLSNLVPRDLSSYPDHQICPSASSCGVSVCCENSDSPGSSILETFSALSFDLPIGSVIAPPQLSDSPLVDSRFVDSCVAITGVPCLSRNVKMPRRLASHLSVLSKTASIPECSAELLDYMRVQLDNPSLSDLDSLGVADLRVAPAIFNCGISLFTIHRTFPIVDGHLQFVPSLAGSSAFAASLLPTFSSLTSTGSSITYLVSSLIPDDHG